MRALKAMGLITFLPSSTDYAVWEAGLLDLTPAAIKFGAMRAKDCTEFMTLPRFRELCRITPADLGMPDAMTAMREACMALDWNKHSFSHPAVLLAARDVGYYDMRNKTEKELFPLYEVAYEQLVRRVLAGEDITAPVAKALPPQVFIPATKEHARDALSRIKGML
jgi:hypothetical protein